MSLEVVALRLYKAWLPDTWTYSFDGTTYTIKETFTNVPPSELKRLETSAIESGSKVLSQNPFVCTKRMNQEEATWRLLEEAVIQAGGLNLLTYGTQGIILDELLRDIEK